MKYLAGVIAAAPLVAMACVGEDPFASPSSEDVDASSMNDASVDSSADAAPPDASPDVAARPCDPAKPFGQPVFVPGVNTAESETHPSLTPDELTIYFARAGEDYTTSDIYVATRPRRQDSFGSAQPISVNHANFDADPMVSHDGRLLFFASLGRSPTKGSTDIYVASRDPLTGALGTPVPVGGVNTPRNDGQPVLAPDGTSFFYVTTLDDGSIELFSGTFASPNVTSVASLERLNTPLDDSWPLASADGLTMFIASNRTDLVPPNSDYNIWVATRRSAAESFDAPVPVPSLNSDNTDGAHWLSPDGCRIYLQSNRPGIGASDIYVAERPK